MKVWKTGLLHGSTVWRAKMYYLNCSNIFTLFALEILSIIEPPAKLQVWKGFLTCHKKCPNCYKKCPDCYRKCPNCYKKCTQLLQEMPRLLHKMPQLLQGMPQLLQKMPQFHFLACDNQHNWEHERHHIACTGLIKSAKIIHFFINNYEKFVYCINELLLTM